VLALLPFADPARACHHPDNLLASSNCGFSSVGTMAPWGNSGCVQNAAINSSQSSEVGAAVCDGVVQGNGTFQISINQCLNAATGAASYDFGFDAQLVSGDPSCSIGVSLFSADDCVSGGGVLLADASSGVALQQNVWNQSAAQSVGDAGTSSASVTILCSSIADFVVNLDDVFIGVGLVPVELQTLSVD
jgi:hypothetical protein